MSKNYIRLELGGKERGLPFKMGALIQLKKLINGDPFEFLNRMLNSDLDGQIELVGTIIYASLLSACDSKKEEPDFQLLDVERWVKEMDYSDCELVLSSFISAYVSKPSGEGGADTRGQAPDAGISSGVSVGGTDAEAVGS